MNPNHPDGLPDAPGWPIHPAMLGTAEQIAGFEVRQTLALVHGWQVLPAGGAGGATNSASVEQARMQALQAMLHDAVRYRANAIIGFRYAMSDGPTTFRILVSGTCVLAHRCDDAR